MASNKGEREADKIINSLNLPTKIKGKRDDTPLTEQAFFDIWELELDVNSKEPKILISGNDSQIILQTSLLNAMNQLLANRGIAYFNFEEWKENFENGYQAFNTGASEELKTLWKEFVYNGIKKENRPKIVELKLHGNNKKRPTYKVVQLYPNRKDQKEWLIFSGSYREIAIQIENWWNQKNAEGVSGKSEIIKRSGHPEVTLHFRQEKDFEAGFQPVKGQISFDLMKLTDNPLVAAQNKDLKLITEKNIKDLGKKINSIFRTKPPYNWGKGKKQVNYHDWAHGYHFIIYCSSFDEGTKLVESVLGIQDHKIDEAFLKHGEAKNPAKAYPAPSEVTVLGKKHRTARLRPKADVVYQYAKLYLPTIRESQVIA